jgi:hypothetical protein
MADAEDVVTTSKSPVIKRMLAFHKLSEDWSQDNRKAGLKALKFRKGGDFQWEGNMLNLRKADNKPSESYNQVPQFVHQITNDMRQNMPSVKFLPGNDGSKEVAEKYEDLARAIQATSEAQVARSKAADSQVTIGWGYWRLITEYENDTSFDKIIKYKWVPNAFAISEDPNAVEEDFSDRRALIESAYMRLSDFNADYKNNKDNDGLKAYGDAELDQIGDSAPSWCNDDQIRIAEYWEVTNERSQLYRNNKSGETTKNKPKDINNYDVREVITPKVTWYKCTALEVLDEKPWDGKYIPYVRVSGERLDIDGKVDFSGLVEHMMPAQRQYNYWTNTATELAALAPKTPYLADVESIKGFEKIWDTANIKNYAYLPYRSYVGTKQYNPPQRVQNSADMGSAMQLVQTAQQNLYVTTGIYPPSLGQKSNESSGVAIRQRQHESDVSTFHFPDNMATAVRCDGRILSDLIGKTYDGARMVRMMKEDKTTYDLKINQKFQNEDTGEEEEYDLTVGTYDVMVDTGPSYTTKRQEAAESMTQIIQAAPQLMQVAGDLLVGNMDWPGADQLAERLKKTLPPQLQDEPSMKNVPPEVQTQMQQMQMMIQQLQQQLQAAGQQLQQQQQELESKQADLQVKMAGVQAGAQGDQLKAQNDQMKLQLDQQKLQLDAEKLELEKAAFQLQVFQAQQMPQETEQPVQQSKQPKLGKNALLGQAADEEESQAMQQQEIQLKATEVQQQGQGIQMLLETLGTIQASIQHQSQAIAMQTQAINTPKTINIGRSPETGLINQASIVPIQMVN